jgi:hypothetical protein
MDRNRSHDDESDSSDQLRNVDDTYVFNSTSGLYQPKTLENGEQRQEQQRGRKSKLPFFVDVRRDWLATAISILTLSVVAAYTYYAKGQWHEMIRAADAAQEAAEAARDNADSAIKRTHLDERAWVTYGLANNTLTDNKPIENTRNARQYRENAYQ